jgi:hypothetical protein
MESHANVRRTWLVIVVAAAVLMLSAPVVTLAFCNTYEDSRVILDWDDVYCGANGFTCTECVTVSGGSASSCWTDGITSVCETANGGFRLY